MGQTRIERYGRRYGSLNATTGCDEDAVAAAMRG